MDYFQFKQAFNEWVDRTNSSIDFTKKGYKSKEEYLSTLFIEYLDNKNNFLTIDSFFNFWFFQS